ncbi:sarcosine oxidase subunit alpha family protein [Marinobacter sp.]|uniref:sarcosine oxidase subunit alpha family protein n=1 Tax=Marinobacter sp. TaxID=50741 RepID=UPI00384B303A
MTQTNRLDKGGRIDRQRPLTFTFNGQRYEGHAGDTLASALLANGVDVVNRSFKYSRPRGIVAAGAEEPNAVMQMGAAEATQIPNVRATQQALFDGLCARSTNPHSELLSKMGNLFSPLIPPGFYYKTFMQPASMWMTYEKVIRKAAGLGRSPRENDPDHYEHIKRHCDVLVIGAGPAGLAAALAAGRSGARVILCDEQEELGGSLLDSRELLDGREASTWVESVLAELAEMDDVLLLPRTTANGLHDHNFVTLYERRAEHLGDKIPEIDGLKPARACLHHVRAGQVVLATGAHERPLVYAHNDLPGNMLAGAVSTYIRRYGVVPGRQLVVSTCHDDGYRAALDWAEAGHRVVAIVDARKHKDAAKGHWVKLAAEKGLQIIYGSAVIEAKGKNRVTGARVAEIDIGKFETRGSVTELACDTIATSGGYNPVVHLSSHTGSRPTWREDIMGFVPAKMTGLVPTGGAAGIYALTDVLKSGVEAGSEAADACGWQSPSVDLPQVDRIDVAEAAPLFQVPHPKTTLRAPKQFVDLQNDVTAAAIELATREGFESIEHVKRYTAMGFGTDQGKLGNINGMAVVARCLKQSIAETGTTVFRPNYTPVAFGAIAGPHRRELFDPERYTALHAWHVERGAKFEDVGQWKRPWYYPERPDETMHDAVARECSAVREKVGVLDASTLGKIDIQGKDVREFLGRIYTNGWEKLAVGKARYGLMCKDDGMVMDDGVTTCLADNHFLMTTTTGGAARILEWLELWHQTEWPELDVSFTSVTDHWATITVTGPEARNLLSEISDIDLDRDTFKFMEWREGEVAGVPARVYRISFTGELSYEINVQAHYAMHVWKKLFEHGDRYGLTPYGTETMHVLRAEKGFIIVGQETDGSVTPEDLGMQWCVGYNKPFSWIGKRALSRPDTRREDRKQMVGLKPVDRQVVLQEGAQIVLDPKQSIPMAMVGHVTSSYYSPTLGHGFALAVVKGGQKRMGERVYLPMADGATHVAEIVSPVFYDPKGDRQNV